MSGLNCGTFHILAAYTTLRNKIACDTIVDMTAEGGRGEDRKSIARELRRGSLELIVLHLLSAGEAYGYEIVSKLVAEHGRRARSH